MGGPGTLRAGSHRARRDRGIRNKRSTRVPLVLSPVRGLHLRPLHWTLQMIRNETFTDAVVSGWVAGHSVNSVAEGSECQQCVHIPTTSASLLRH